MKTVSILTTNETTALRKIIDIINDYKSSKNIEVIKCIRNKKSVIVEFSNGDCYKWIRPNSRCQKVTNDIINIGTIDSPILIADLRDKVYDIDTLIDKIDNVGYIKGNTEIRRRDSELGIYRG